MKSLKTIYKIFFLLALCFQLHAHATEQTFFSTSSEQIVVQEDGLFYFDDFGFPMPIETITHCENGKFLIELKSAVCGHQYGCRACRGCSQMSCWNFCPGCR